MAGNGGVSRCYHVEGIVFAVGTPCLVGKLVAWRPPPPWEFTGLVILMYKMLDGVFMWQIRVKTLGFRLWSEPVMAAYPTCLKASLR
jgi:hypothetical protein